MKELKRSNKLLIVFVGMLVLCTLSMIEENIIFLLSSFVVISAIVLPYSQAFALFAGSLCFEVCFGSHFKLFLFLFLVVLFFKSAILYSSEKWTKTSRVFKIVVILSSLYLILTPLINSLICGKFNFSAYFTILILILAIFVGYFSYKKVDLGLVTRFLALGVVVSSMMSILFVMTDIMPSTAFSVNDTFLFSALCASRYDLAIISIITLLFLSYYCMNNKQTLAYAYFLPIVLIGLFTFSKLFVILLLIDLIVISIMILANNKSNNKNVLTIVCFITISVIVCLLIFNFIFNDELLLFSNQSWRGVFDKYKNGFNSSWNMISSKTRYLIFGMPLKTVGLLSNFSGVVSLVSNLGLLGLGILLVLSTVLLVKGGMFKKNLAGIIACITFLAFSVFFDTFLSALIGLAVCACVLNSTFDAQTVSHENEGEKIKEGMYKFLKRAFDVLVSSVALIILFIPMIIVGIIIKATSQGPVFFKDKRVGKDGKDIVVLKFRSMYKDAEARLEQYLTKEQLEMWQKERKVDNDPRITKVGKFIRKTSIDELPQLINILKGDLSIIGNRPLSKTEYNTHFSEEEKKVLDSMRPGLTGYWQAYGRSNVTFLSGERQKMYIYYPKNASLLLDIKIFFKTIIVVLTHKGAK